MKKNIIRNINNLIDKANLEITKGKIFAFRDF